MATPGDPTTAKVGDKRRLGRSAPRSRSGCTTCKRRKVRCDETVPVCANCTRLGAECIYQRIQRRKHHSPTDDSVHSSLQNAVTEKATVDDPSQHDGEDHIDTDSGIESALHPDSTLFFDFEAFSRNAMDLWCSPITALPTIPYPEVFDDSGIPALDHVSHNDTVSAMPIESLTTPVRFLYPILLHPKLTDFGIRATIDISSPTEKVTELNSMNQLTVLIVNRHRRLPGTTKMFICYGILSQVSSTW